MFRRSERLMNAAVEAPAPGGAAAPATAPAPAPAAPAPAPAESLLRAPAAAPAPGAAPAAAPPAAGEFDWLPEKYRVNGADGKLDLNASSRKLSEGYAAAQQRIGTGDLPPQKPEDYKVTMPEAMKDMPLDEALSTSFRAEAHKNGLTQKQFDFVMAEYFKLVPEMLDGAAKASADAARAELQAVWKTPAEYEQGMSAAQRVVASMPAALQEQLHERFGTDPLFLQFAAQLGKEMREDRPPSGAPGSQATGSLEELMRHPAYRDPKHAQHAAISEQARKLSEKLYGAAPVT